MPLTSELESEKNTARELAEKLRTGDDLAAVLEAATAAGRTPRGAALLRESGCLKAACSVLRGTQASVVVNALSLVEALIATPPGAMEFVEYGGHGLILRLMNLGDGGSIAEAVDNFLANTASVASKIGRPFPSLDVGRVLGEDEIASAPLLKYDFQAGNGDARSVLVQSIPEGQQCQFTVGYLMWPAAVVLARWLTSYEDLLRGRSVHELGAGLGLSGLAAAWTARSIVLTDFNPRVVENLEETCGMNAFEGSASCSAHFLDWTDMEAAQERAKEPVDLVVASDVVCQVDDAYALAGAIERLVATNGAAVIVLPAPKNRFGTEAFPPALDSQGLVWRRHDICAAHLTTGLDEADYFTWQAYFIWKSSGTDETQDFPSEWHRSLHKAVEAVSSD